MTGSNIYSGVMTGTLNEARKVLKELNRERCQAKTRLVEAIGDYNGAVHLECEVWKMYSARLELELKKAEGKS